MNGLQDENELLGEYVSCITYEIIKEVCYLYEVCGLKATKTQYLNYIHDEYNRGRFDAKVYKELCELEYMYED